MGTELRASDLVAVREQLGREPLIPFTVVVRCTGGHPLVIRNAVRDASGSPFPTTYWLTCQEAGRAVSRLESEGWIARLNDRAEAEADFGRELEEAHAAYATERALVPPEASGWGGVGGTRVGIKCLHAHYAYHLSGGTDPVGRWVAERVEPVHPDADPHPVAVVDQGTNSIRLLVMERSGGRSELARDMVITRLGEGIDRTGVIATPALERTVSVLDRFCRRARALGAERVRVAATSAVRDATNRESLEEAVRRLAGTELEVISGEREAGLSFLGATLDLDQELAPTPWLVFDIGGGSTEFFVGGAPGEPKAGVSTRMGSVRLTERWVRHDPPTSGEIDAMRSEVEGILNGAEGDVGLSENGTLVAVAGTATTVQALALGLPRYDPDAIHRSWLSVGDAEEVFLELAGMTTAERSALPVMAPGRGDVILAGAVILVAVMRRAGVERALVSETDILDGLAFETIGIK